MKKQLGDIELIDLEENLYISRCVSLPNHIYLPENAPSPHIYVYIYIYIYISF